MPTADLSFPWADLIAATGGSMSTATDPGVIQAVITDSRQPAPPGALFLALVGERFDGHDFLPDAIEKGAAALCIDDAHLTPELIQLCSACQVGLLTVADTLAAYQRIAHVRRRACPDLTVVGITGSSGKTSTKTIISAVLEAAFPEQVLSTAANTNNQVGVPQNLMRLSPGHRAAVIEMGTNAPGEIRPLADCAWPDIAVLTNIGPVHLEKLGSIAGVAAEKAQIFANLAATKGWAILPTAWADHPAVAPLLPAGRTLTVGSDPGAHLRVEWLGGDLDRSRFIIHRAGRQPLELEWPIAGPHQAQNAATAAGVAQILGLDDSVVVQGLHRVELPGYRMRRELHHGITWLNDAYNANPDSVGALLQVLAGLELPAPSRLFLVLGDMLELGEDSPSLHAETLARALELLPDARIQVFGPRLSAAATAYAGLPAFTDIAALQAHLQTQLAPGDFVALKGSRGMALERLLPRT